MFPGHISAAVASKPIVPKINLLILIAAAQLIDILFFWTMRQKETFYFEWGYLRRFQIMGCNAGLSIKKTKRLF